MKKMLKHHRGRVRLKEKMLKNSRAWRRWRKKKSRVTRWREGELTHDQHSTVSPKMTKTSTEPPGLPKRRGGSVDVEDGHRGGGLRSSRECQAEEHVSRDRHQTNRGPRMEKGFKGPGGENIKNYVQQVMSVRTPEGFVRKSTWKVADVRWPLCRRPTSSKLGTICSLGRTRRRS